MANLQSFWGIRKLANSVAGQWKEQPPSGCAKSRDHDGSGWIERRGVVSHTGSWNVLVILYNVLQDITMEELLHSKGFLTDTDTPPLHTTTMSPAEATTVWRLWNPGTPCNPRSSLPLSVFAHFSPMFVSQSTLATTCKKYRNRLSNGAPSNCRQSLPSYFCWGCHAEACCEGTLPPCQPGYTSPLLVWSWFHSVIISVVPTS